MTVPASVVEKAERSGFPVDGALDVDFDETTRSIVVASRRPRYLLADLLAGCDPKASISREDRAWLDDGPVGAELI